MAHFAELDENNTVLQVVVVSNEVAVDESAGLDFLSELLGQHKRWLQCSYNGNIRKQYPGVGYTYDAVSDVFIAPPPYVSWVLDENHDWKAPKNRPKGQEWVWDEESLSWIDEGLNG